VVFVAPPVLLPLTVPPFPAPNIPSRLIALSTAP
jgi:hypothetical protein